MTITVKEYLDSQPPERKASRAKVKSKLEAKGKGTLTKGSHLDVVTYKDGTTILVWNDDALEQDVRRALEMYEKSRGKE